MENSKSKLMRHYTQLLLLFSFIINSCQGQVKPKTTYPEKNIMETEKFDIKTFEEHTKKHKELEAKQIFTEDGQGPYNKITVLSDGTFIEEMQGTYDGIRIYIKDIIPPPPALFKESMKYRADGSIESKSKSFLGRLMIPPFYNVLVENKYDEDGKLIKTIDYTDFDKDLKIGLLELLEQLQKEPLLSEIDNDLRDNLYDELFNNEYYNALYTRNIKKEEITVNSVLEALVYYEVISENENITIFNPHNDYDRENIRISLIKKDWIVTKSLSRFGYFTYTIDSNNGEIKKINFEFPGYN